MKTRKQFNKEDTLLFKIEYIYDEQNRILESRTYDNDKESKVTYSYVNTGYTRTSYNTDGEIESTTVVTLNENGDIIKEINMPLQIEKTYEYDENNFLIKETGYF